MNRSLALALGATLVAGCGEVSTDSSFHPDYEYVTITGISTSYSDGHCAVTGVRAVAKKDAVWGRIAVIKYGRVWNAYDGESFFGSNTIKAGETQHGQQEVSALTSGRALVQFNYSDPNGSHKRLRTLTARC